MSGGRRVSSGRAAVAAESGSGSGRPGLSAALSLASWAARGLLGSPTSSKKMPHSTPLMGLRADRSIVTDAFQEAL